MMLMVVVMMVIVVVAMVVVIAVVVRVGLTVAFSGDDSHGDNYRGCQ